MVLLKIMIMPLLLIIIIADGNKFVDPVIDPVLTATAKPGKLG
jgi:hypothetical protein